LARPYDEKKAEYDRIKAQVDKIDSQLDVIVEQYNEANYSLSKTEEELRIARDKLQAAEKELADRREAINKRFDGVYRQGGFSYVEMLINSKSLDQFLYYLELIERLTEQDAKMIDEMKAVKKQVEEQSAILFEKEEKQKALLAEIKVKKDKIAVQLKEKNALLSKVKNELRSIREAELREEAKRQAELRRSLRASYDPDRPGDSVSRGGSRSGVVGIAMSQLGKPYSWGGTGPGSFDCSGLTRYVYAQVGVSLPHSSRAQYGCGQRISRGSLQPGDLVFFARGGTISHVGIYVGGDSFIHSPRTGDVVRVSSISAHGGYVGAARP